MAEPKTCTVSFRDPAGLRHSVDVTASSLYEAVALALRAFQQQGLLADVQVGASTEIVVEARATSVRHTTTLASLERWMNANGRSPKEALAKDRVRSILRVN